MGRNSVFSNLLWRFAERCGAQFVTFFVSIILARLLNPEVYGVVAMVTVFTSILQVFVDSGLGNALIQKKNADSADFSTVFYANIVFCLGIYALLYACAPLIATFYHTEELTPLVRVMGITILISGIKNVQQAYVSRTMIFKKFFFATLAGTITAAVVGITMALLGFGVWAIVVQNLCNQLIDTLFLWATVKWRPTKEFSFKRLKGLFAYGWKLLLASLLNTVYTDLRQLIIGRYYSSESLAFYNRGKQFPNLVATNIDGSINSVLFPAMSSVQDEKNAVRDMTRRSIRVSGFVMWPMLLGLAAIAEPLVRLVLTDKWLECVPYLRIFCITSAFQPIQTANLNAIKARGRSDIFLKLEIIKKSVGILMILVVARYGVMAIALSMIAFSFFAQIVNSTPNKTLLGYSYLDQLKDILPIILLSAVMCVPVYMIQYLHMPLILTLVLQVITGAVFFIGESVVFKVQELYYLLDVVSSLFFRKKKMTMS